MKKIFLLAVLACSFSIANAQFFNVFGDVKNPTAEQCKQAESKILDCATYLLSTPEEITTLRNNATQSLIIWMTATPDYTFSINMGNKYGKDEDDSMLLRIYMAAQTKYMLENPANKKNEKEVQLGTYKLLLDYCAKEENQVKQTKWLKKIKSEYDKGTLASYLKL